MAGILMPALGYVIGSSGYKPLNCLVRNQWRTLEAVRELTEPLLFLSGLKVGRPILFLLFHSDAEVPALMKANVVQSHVRTLLGEPHCDAWMIGVSCLLFRAKCSLQVYGR
jgi:hypothetical protein